MKKAKCVINLENISQIYSQRNDKKIVIFKNMTYQFYSKRIYLIKGMSGAGKTTLINIIGTILNPNSGRIIIDGKEITKMSENDKALVRKDQIGFIFQDYYLHPHLKAYENVMIPLYLNNSNENKKELAIKKLIEMGLEDRINHYPKELSGGEQQRVAIARALINNPQIILADEPTGALDSDNEEKILKLLKKIALDGKCVIIVSHSKNVEKYADEILYINNQTIIGDENVK